MHKLSDEIFDRMIQLNELVKNVNLPDSDTDDFDVSTDSIDSANLSGSSNFSVSPGLDKRVVNTVCQVTQRARLISVITYHISCQVHTHQYYVGSGSGTRNACAPS